MSILVRGQWSRLVNSCTTCNQSVTDYSIHNTETKATVFISHIIAHRHMIDNKKTSNRCNHIWLWKCSLDGDTLQLQNGRHPSDVAKYILALIHCKRLQSNYDDAYLTCLPQSENSICRRQLSQMDSTTEGSVILI